jgi:hypothetical protein
MSNFEEIVVRIAESKGIDFASLTKERQDNVMGELFLLIWKVFSVTWQTILMTDLEEGRGYIKAPLQVHLEKTVQMVPTI